MMNRAAFYRTKYYVVESFYEKIVMEHYTAAQAVDRCLTEFRFQISGGGLEALAVYSELFSKAALLAPEELHCFRRQINEMTSLLTPEIQTRLPGDALEDLTDDMELINRTLNEGGAS